MLRAYTKSGSVEKYESEQWATPVWSGSVTGTVTGPDSNGNYTVNAPTNYVVTNTDVSWNHGVTCTTNYAQVKKYFYFSPVQLNCTFYFNYDSNHMWVNCVTNYEYAFDYISNLGIKGEYCWYGEYGYESGVEIFHTYYINTNKSGEGMIIYQKKVQRQPGVIMCTLSHVDEPDNNPYNIQFIYNMINVK